jgi:hypothetical protein
MSPPKKRSTRKKYLSFEYKPTLMDPPKGAPSVEDRPIRSSKVSSIPGGSQAFPGSAILPKCLGI